MATNFSLSTITSIETGANQGVSMVGSHGDGKLFTDNGTATIDDVKVDFLQNPDVPAQLTLTPVNLEAVNMDLNNVNTKYDVSVDLSEVKEKNTVVINSGKTSVDLSAAANKVDTLVFDGNDGVNQIAHFEKQDVISFGREVALDELKITGDNDGHAIVSLGDNAATVVSLASGSAVETANIAELNIGAKKILANVGDAAVALEAADDVSYFYGLDDGKTSVKAAGTSKIDLTETDRYSNINAVEVAAAQTKAIEITANTDKKGTVATYIDGSAAKASQTININGADEVILSTGAAKYADTVKISAGTNKITNFTTGLEASDDTLVLSSVSALSDVTYNSATAILTAGKVNTTFVDASVKDSEIMKIQLADGSDYKVAADYTGGNSGITLKLDTATNGSEGKQKVMFATNAGAAATTGIVFDSTLQDASFAYTNDKGNADLYYTGAGVASIDGRTAKGNMYIGDVAEVSTGTGTNIVWSYSQDDAQIQANNDGTDMIVLSGNFSKNTLVDKFQAATDAVWAFTTVDASDTSKYGNVKSLKDFANNFNISAADNTLVSIGTGKVDDVDYFTTIKGAQANEAFTVIVGDGSKKFKVATDNSTIADSITFATDINYYVAAGAGQTSVTASKDAVIAAGNKLDVVLGTENVTDESTVIYADNVIVFDARAAEGATINLAGSAKVGNTLFGGANSTNTLYGGGSSDDTLIGNVSSADIFKFGIFDGNDAIGNGVINGGLDAKDTINLYNLTEADIANVTITVNEAAHQAVLNTTNGTLTMNFTLGTVVADDIAKLSFTDINGTKYSYNDGKLVKA